MNIIHNLAHTRVYNAWHNMRLRCNDPTNPGYINYGGRGITYDPRWENLLEFFKDMGHCPKGLMLERINNNGNYNKTNCIWTTRKRQNNNRRIFKNNMHGISGVCADGIYWRARAYDTNGRRLTLYKGKDYFEACCARKSWENYHGA